jgi:hypothetical protein
LVYCVEKNLATLHQNGRFPQMEKYEESIRRTAALKLANKSFPTGDHQQLHRHNQINGGQPQRLGAAATKARCLLTRGHYFGEFSPLT